MADPVKNDRGNDPEKMKVTGGRLDSASSRSSEQAEIEHRDQPGQDEPKVNHGNAGVDDAAKAAHEKNQKLANPLAGLGHEKLSSMGEKYARFAGLDSEEDIRAFRLGAIIAGDENKYDTVKGITPEEIEVLEREVTHKWSNPKKLYWVIAICSLCAAVQGMDETVVNGAQAFYKKKFGIGSSSGRDAWLVGLVNSAPYLCCAFMGCWLTDPMNKKFGRRGTVFISCLVSAAACFWQAFTNTWWHMFIARFFLGFGIGPKSATTPIYSAECSPPKLRGALVMQWQLWTAFGIMMGYVMDLVFYPVPDRGIALGLNWRLMMGSAMIPAVIVVCLVFLCPESPRWYLTKGRHHDAYNTLCELRFNKLQAARDLFYMHTLLEAEKETMTIGKSARIKEFFTLRRNRNAIVASEIVMFMQQFCGVNVIAYYSTEIFLDAGFPELNALAASLGFGIINWLFAIPGMYTIDTFGRRNLLLTTFPLMALCMFFTGFSFWIPKTSTAHIACIALGVYLFGIVYSPGEGPVPFTYSAEAYPLYIRPIGMSLATATLWFFNFVLSVTWPALLKAFSAQGAFGWYGAWNLIGFTLVLFFVPETKERTLEELDTVFGVPLRDHARYGAAQFSYFIQRWVFMRRSAVKPKVPHLEELEYHEKTFVQERETDATRRV